MISLFGLLLLQALPGNLHALAYVPLGAILIAIPLRANISDDATLSRLLFTKAIRMS